MAANSYSQKIIAVILVTIFLMGLIAFPEPAKAQNTGTGEGQGYDYDILIAGGSVYSDYDGHTGRYILTGGEAWNVNLYNENALAEEEKRASTFERAVAAVLVSFPNWIMNVIGLDDPVSLIYNMPPEWGLNDAKRQFNKVMDDKEDAEKQLETLKNNPINADDLDYDDFYEYVDNLEGEERKAYLDYLQKYGLTHEDAQEVEWEVKIRQLEASIRNLEGQTKAIFERIAKERQKVTEYHKRREYLHTFSENEFIGIAYLYDTFNKLIPFPMMLALIIIAYNILLGGSSGQHRTGMKALFEGIVLFLVLTKSGPLIWNLVFDLNNFFVDLVRTALGGIIQGGFLQSLYFSSPLSVGTAIITVASVSMLGVLNWQYIVRKITLGILIVLYVIMSFLVMFPGKRQAWNIWLKLFVSTVFLQAVHALTFGFFLIFIRSNLGQTQGFITSLVCLFSLTTISGVIQQVVLGDDKPGLAGTLSRGVGIPALAATAMLGASVFRPIGGRLAGGGTSGDAIENADPVNSATANMSNGSKRSFAAPGFKDIAGKVAQAGGRMALAAGGKTLAAGMAYAGSTVGGIISGAISGNASSGQAIGMLTGGRIYNIGNKAVGEIPAAFNNARNYFNPGRQYLLNQGIEPADLKGLNRHQMSELATGLDGRFTSNTAILEETQQNLDRIAGLERIDTSIVHRAEAEKIRADQVYDSIFTANQEAVSDYNYASGIGSVGGVLDATLSVNQTTQQLKIAEQVRKEKTEALEAAKTQQVINKGQRGKENYLAQQVKAKEQLTQKATQEFVSQKIKSFREANQYRRPPRLGALL